MGSSAPVHRAPINDPLADALKPRDRYVLLVAGFVFVITIALRVPSCYESFWLDELHSAWVVWGDFSDVATRARSGHQSPFYFWALWCWRQAAGESEVTLRLSSVLAVSMSGVVVTIAAAKWTNSLAAAATAGMLLAIESNSLFFGTELRPYALVILFASLAAACFLALLSIGGRHERPRVWAAMVLAILIAMLCQPTAAGVLVWLPLVLMIRWVTVDRRQTLRCTLQDGFLLIAAAAVVLTLWESTIGESWGQRFIWSSFAAATQFGQLVQVWDWTWLCLIPAGLTIAASIVLRTRSRPIPVAVGGTLLLALIAAVATSGYWLVSRAEWIPLWHRRYFVAVLPLFTLVAAGGVASVESLMRQRWQKRAVGWVTAMGLVVGLAWQQGTLVRLRHYPVALITRGEDWRAAIDWLKSNTQPEDAFVNLDSGMIESQALPIGAGKGRDLSPAQIGYLCFPVSGPYRLDRSVVPVRNLQSIDLPPGRSVVHVLTRRPQRSLNRHDGKSGNQIIGFGNLSVIVVDRRVDQSSVGD